MADKNTLTLKDIKELIRNEITSLNPKLDVFHNPSVQHSFAEWIVKTYLDGIPEADWIQYEQRVAEGIDWVRRDVFNADTNPSMRIGNGPIASLPTDLRNRIYGVTTAQQHSVSDLIVDAIRKDITDNNQKNLLFNGGGLGAIGLNIQTWRDWRVVDINGVWWACRPSRVSGKKWRLERNLKINAGTYKTTIPGASNNVELLPFNPDDFENPEAAGIIPKPKPTTSRPTVTTPSSSSSPSPSLSPSSVPISRPTVTIPFSSSPTSNPLSVPTSSVGGGLGITVTSGGSAPSSPSGTPFSLGGSSSTPMPSNSTVPTPITSSGGSVPPTGGSTPVSHTPNGSFSPNSGFSAETPLLADDEPNVDKALRMDTPNQPLSTPTPEKKSKLDIALEKAYDNNAEFSDALKAVEALQGIVNNDEGKLGHEFYWKAALAAKRLLERYDRLNDLSKFKTEDKQQDRIEKIRKFLAQAHGQVMSYEINGEVGGQETPIEKELADDIEAIAEAENKANEALEQPASTGTPDEEQLPQPVARDIYWDKNKKQFLVSEEVKDGISRLKKTHPEVYRELKNETIEKALRSLEAANANPNFASLLVEHPELWDAAIASQLMTELNLPAHGYLHAKGKDYYHDENGKLRCKEEIENRRPTILATPEITGKMSADREDFLDFVNNRKSQYIPNKDYSPEEIDKLKNALKEQKIKHGEMPEDQRYKDVFSKLIEGGYLQKTNGYIVLGEEGNNAINAYKELNQKSDLEYDEEVDALKKVYTGQLYKEHMPYQRKEIDAVFESIKGYLQLLPALRIAEKDLNAKAEEKGESRTRYYLGSNVIGRIIKDSFPQRFGPIEKSTDNSMPSESTAITDGATESSNSVIPTEEENGEQEQNSAENESLEQPASASEDVIDIDKILSTPNDNTATPSGIPITRKVKRLLKKYLHSPEVAQYQNKKITDEEMELASTWGRRIGSAGLGVAGAINGLGVIPSFAGAIGLNYGLSGLSRLFRKKDKNNTWLDVAKDFGTAGGIALGSLAGPWGMLAGGAIGNRGAQYALAARDQVRAWNPLIQDAGNLKWAARVAVPVAGTATGLMKELWQDVLARPWRKSGNAVEMPALDEHALQLGVDRTTKTPEEAEALKGRHSFEGLVERGKKTVNGKPVDESDDDVFRRLWDLSDVNNLGSFSELLKVKYKKDGVDKSNALKSFISWESWQRRDRGDTSAFKRALANYRAVDQMYKKGFLGISPRFMEQLLNQAGQVARPEYIEGYNAALGLPDNSTTGIDFVDAYVSLTDYAKKTVGEQEAELGKMGKAGGVMVNVPDSGMNPLRWLGSKLGFKSSNRKLVKPNFKERQTAAIKTAAELAPFIKEDVWEIDGKEVRGKKFDQEAFEKAAEEGKISKYAYAVRNDPMKRAAVIEERAAEEKAAAGGRFSRFAKAMPGLGGTLSAGGKLMAALGPVAKVATSLGALGVAIAKFTWGAFKKFSGAIETWADKYAGYSGTMGALYGWKQAREQVRNVKFAEKTANSAVDVQVEMENLKDAWQDFLAALLNNGGAEILKTLAMGFTELFKSLTKLLEFIPSWIKGSNGEDNAPGGEGDESNSGWRATVSNSMNGFMKWNAKFQTKHEYLGYMLGGVVGKGMAARYMSDPTRAAMVNSSIANDAEAEEVAQRIYERRARNGELENGSVGSKLAALIHRKTGRDVKVNALENPFVREEYFREQMANAENYLYELKDTGRWKNEYFNDSMFKHLGFDEAEASGKFLEDPQKYIDALERVKANTGGKWDDKLSATHDIKGLLEAIKVLQELFGENSGYLRDIKQAAEATAENTKKEPTHKSQVSYQAMQAMAMRSTYQGGGNPYGNRTAQPDWDSNEGKQYGRWANPGKTYIVGR